MSRRAKGILLSALLGAIVVTAGLIASAFVKVPYWSIGPGSLTETTGLVVVDGAEVYPSEGELLYSTVRVRGRLTIWGLVAGWLDPAVSIVREDEVLGDRDAEENRRINVQLMDTSKQTATYLALQLLGYEVRVTGSGAIILHVQEGQPADGVLEPGDSVVSVDGEPVEIADDLIEAIGSRPPGTSVELRVSRRGSAEVESVQVVLGEREDDPSVAFLGVVPETRDIGFEFPLAVDFATGRVGGPSAGLAFTLALIDLLTPGELTGGHLVAVTGAIDLRGNVGPVGGVEQKVAAARRAGVGYFIIPARLSEHEREAAHREAGDEVTLFEVSSLGEALEALELIAGEPLRHS